MANYNAGTRMFYTRPSDGATYCFSPVPLLAESKEYLRTADGETRLAVVHELTFTGTLLATIPELSGVPTTASCLQLLDRKSDQLASALEDRGQLLVVDSSGYPVISTQPIVQSLSFDESQMVQQRPYTLVFSYEDDFGTDKVRDYTETWEFAQQEDDTVSVSHTVTAIGIHDPVGGTTALEAAKSFVLARAGTVDKSQSSFIQVPYVQALVAVSGYGAYNHVLSENIGVTDGSYEITETWVMSSGNFQDDRIIEESYELDEFGVLQKTLTINGTVNGYGDTTFDRYSNAIDGFENFVAPQIEFYTASGIRSKSLTKNRLGGSVAYSVAILPDDSSQLTSRSISRQIERQEDGSVVQTVTTSATVDQASASGIVIAEQFCFENCYPIDSAEPLFDASLSGNLVSVNTSRDDVAKSYSLTRVFHDQNTSLYREEYSIERQRSVDSSATTISINGTVFGLGIETSTKSQVRFANASGAYFGTIEGLLYDRAAQLIPSDACIGDTPTNQTLGASPLAGTISYSATYESRFKTSNSDILSEQIEISINRQSDVVAVIPIPGKADGPILQSQETVTGREKSLSISYTMKAGGDACDNAVINSNTLIHTALAESDILVDNTPSQNSRGEKPDSSSRVFKTSDTYTFNRQTNVFTRSVTWQYI